MKKIHKDPEPEPVKPAKPMPPKESEKPAKAPKTNQSDGKKPLQANATQKPEEAKTF